MISFVDSPVASSDASVTQALQDLRLQPAKIAPKFFYDTLGSRLFDAITALPEYYPTRTEASILHAHGAAIAAAVHRHVGVKPTLVDLGAGNCEKAVGLFDVLDVKRYVAVDISSDYLRNVLTRIQRERPTVDVMGVGMDFSQSLSLPAGVLSGPSLLFYPGSSISNFEPQAALQFLREARAVAAGGALLIGVDLVKAKSVLEPAYDDALGVTAAFNLNVLSNLNQQAGTDFRPQDWEHVAFYNDAASRIEMHLQAKHEVLVHVPDQAAGQPRRFGRGERILTEYSYKWQTAQFGDLLRRAGFAQVQTWTDPQAWFAVMLAHDAPHR
jgi:L-histidine Nalpha-methyltransferase